MRQVVHLIDGIPTISEIPDSWICCSVSGEFRPPAEFKNAEGRARTNCLRTYRDMSLDEMEATMQATAKAQRSDAWAVLWKQLNATRKDNAFFMECRGAAISRDDLIAQLLALPTDANFVITHRYEYGGSQIDAVTPTITKLDNGFYSLAEIVS